EAYCDFAPESCVPLLADQDNWLVVRTFAKSYGLAGLRVGYALGHPDLIADVSAVIEIYPVDRLALGGAGWDLVPSQANFVLGRPPGGDAAGVASELRQQRILVRHFPDGDHRDRL